MSERDVDEVVPNGNEVLLSPPHPKAVRHAMRDVGYEERLVIHRMTAGLGNTAVDVYGFADLVGQIFGTQWDRLHVEGSKGNLMWVDADRLTAWIADVIGDRELADAVSVALEGRDDYKSRIEAMYPVFRERVTQYETALSEDGGTT